MQGLSPALADNRSIPRPRSLASDLQFDNGSHGGPRSEEESSAMSRIIASIALLLLAVVHAPSQAQALVFSVFQDLFPFSTTNEPITLVLTGIGLLSLAQLGRPRSQ
jgi:hypothetical protein